MNHQEQINHDKSKTRTQSKLHDDGDPWAPNNLLTLEQRKNTSWTPVGQATDKKLRSQPAKMHSFKKVQVGKDQEKTQSEKDSHSKNRGGKKPN